MKWPHGGDVCGYRLEYGKLPLDFSANVSPLGTPQGVQRAAEAALTRGAEYPDPQCRELRNALADTLGVPVPHILCGNGAADLIYRLAAALRPKAALITAPTFSEYEAALSLWGCRIRRFPLEQEEGFPVTEKLLDWITPETELVFLCQPNNPTGRMVEPALLERILERCRMTGTFLAVDECFLDFLDEPERYSLLPRLQGNPLLLLRAFTKFYGMAGLRLGYCLCGDTALLERMARAGAPWPVSVVAQAAGAAALREAAYAQRLRALIAQQRPLLREELTKAGCRVVPGAANFLLFRHPDESLGDKLREKGVLIRDCRNYHGLGPGWYRVAVRTETENRLLLAAIKEVTGGCPDAS